MLADPEFVVAQAVEMFGEFEILSQLKARALVVGVVGCEEDAEAEGVIRFHHSILPIFEGKEHPFATHREVALDAKSAPTGPLIRADSHRIRTGSPRFRARSHFVHRPGPRIGFGS